MGLNIEITQSSYWGGTQIPYWFYMVLVIFPITGILGIDHLLLRSPMTAILKFLSLIPLFGFWYFYDIAQLGEGETIKKNGIGIPFYGPQGIGAGMFIEPGKGLSPKEMPRPWAFIGYVLTSILFLAFPINKLIVGDYFGALAQLCMLIIAPLALAWSIYDIYRILFDTKGVMEKGTARIPPATFFISGYFTKAMDVLGNKKSEPEPPGILGTVASLAIKPLEAASDGLAGAATAATGAVASAADAAGAVAKGVGDLGRAASGASAVVSAASAVQSGVPSAISKATKGGAMIMNTDPSSTTIVVLFGVALLAFSGYAYSAMRKIRTVRSEKDDSPPNPATAGRVARTEE